jgi:lambda family phage tail tape measure protein
MQAQASRAGLSLDKQQLDLLGKLIIARDASRSAEKIREYSREQERVIDLLKLEANAVNRTALQQKQLVDQRNFEAQLIKDTIGMQPAQKQAYEENARMLFQQRQELERVNYEQSRTFEFGAKKAFRSYLDDLGNVAKATEQLFNNAFKSIEDSMVNAFNTGKLSFKSLVDSIMADITRLVVRQAIMRPIMGAIGMGGSGGGGFGALLGSGFNLLGATNIGTALTYGTNIGSQQTAMLAAQDAAFLADGTNEVPYDNFPAILHKGEAVVPAKYNPAVGGQSGEMSVTYSPIINIDSRTDSTQVRQLVVSAVQQGQMDLVDKINRGQVRIRQ